MSPGARPDTALIGAGRLARAIGPLLSAAGYPLVAVAAQRVASVRRLVREAAPDALVATPVEALRAARLVLLAVPDEQIAPLAGRLASDAAGELSGRVVLHHAGRLGPGVLAPLAEGGAAVAVLHPLQTLADAATSAALLRGSFARIEGTGAALRTATRLARDLGMVPLRPVTAIGRRERELYHAAASLAANDVLALLDVAVDVMSRAGIDRGEATRGLLRLMQGALSNAEKLGPARALTGPVARGDREAVAAHLARLGRGSRPAGRLHRLLSSRLIEMAVAAGRLSPRRARELRRLLRPVAGPAGKPPV